MASHGLALQIVLSHIIRLERFPEQCTTKLCLVSRKLFLYSIVQRETKHSLVVHVTRTLTWKPL